MKPGPLERRYRAAVSVFLILVGAAAVLGVAGALLWVLWDVWRTMPGERPRLNGFGAMCAAAFIFGWCVPAILRWIDRKRGQE